MLTSENAGAAIFRTFFHSSPSEAMMFDPKRKVNTSYRNTGFGNFAREFVTSYEAGLKEFDSILGKVDVL